MKKLLTLAAAALLGAACMQAAAPAFALQPKGLATPLESNILLPAKTQASPLKAPATRADATQMYFGYCADECGGAYLFPTEKLKVAFKIPAAEMTPFKGNKITGVRLFNPCALQIEGNQAYLTETNTIKKATIFLTYDNQKDPFLTTEVDLTDKGMEWVDYMFSQPYEVEGRTVYVGVDYGDYDPNAVCATLFDGANPTAGGCLIYSSADLNSAGNALVNTGTYAWKNWSEYFGDILLKAIIEGDTLPQNAASVANFYVPGYTQPNTDFNVEVLVKNEAANALSNVTIDVKVGDQPVQTVTSEILVPVANPQTQQYDYVPGEIEYSKTGIALAPVQCTAEGVNVPVSFTITKLNGENVNNNTNNTGAGNINCFAKGYDKNVVIEEFTGVHCGWCPRGIVGIEETYKIAEPGRFIPIAVHCNVPTNDPLDVCGTGKAYNAFASKIPGAPAAVVDRNWLNILNCLPEEFIASYQAGVADPSLAEVKATVSDLDATAKTVTLTTNATFAIDITDADYGICYTIREDNLGPYEQSNSYAGGGAGQMGGWENLPYNVKMYYNHVARNGSVVEPIANSIPTSITAGEPVEFSTTVNLKYVKHITPYSTNEVQIGEDGQPVIGEDGQPVMVTAAPTWSIVPMIINRKTGEVVNAVEVWGPDCVGLKDVKSDSQRVLVGAGLQGAIDLYAPADVYGMDGRLVLRAAQGVHQLPAGLYVARTARGVAKLLVR